MNAARPIKPSFNRRALATQAMQAAAATRAIRLSILGSSGARSSVAARAAK